MKILSTLLTLACLSGCTTEEQTAQPPAEDEQMQPPGEGRAQPPATAAAAIHHAMCGCSIEGIDVCGNYIQVDDEYVPLEHPSLGAMQFCAQKKAGVDLKVVGGMQDGKFVAESWEIVK